MKKRSIKEIFEILNDRYKSEDTNKPDIKLLDKTQEVLGHCGQMLSGSKSGYLDRHPKNVAIFNANVCVKAGKVWFGDLDLTKSLAKLKELAKVLNEKVYVLYEMDGRFQNESKPKLDNAICCIAPNGIVTINNVLKHIEMKRGKIVKLE